MDFYTIIFTIKENFCGFYIGESILKSTNNILVLIMKKKTIAVLVLMLVVAYGLSMATTGVSMLMPGCSESGP
ncbi:MAG: hypothetical protein ACQERB_02695 [Promethearchaeati archaeon]